jgi:hypothetical protein
VPLRKNKENKQSWPGYHGKTKKTNSHGPATTEKQRKQTVMARLPRKNKENKQSWPGNIGIGYARSTSHIRGFSSFRAPPTVQKSKKQRVRCPRHHCPPYAVGTNCPLFATSTAVANQRHAPDTVLGSLERESTMPKRSREGETVVIDRLLVNHTCPVSLHLLADAVSVKGKAYNVRLSSPAAGTVTDSVGCFFGS